MGKAYSLNAIASEFILASKIIGLSPASFYAIVFTAK
jgi:hypothetical protein